MLGTFNVRAFSRPTETRGAELKNLNDLETVLPIAR
jgi:hypothetical protein